MRATRISTGKRAAYAIGDIHGEFHQVRRFVEEGDIRDACVVVCGDCGLGFRSKEVTEILLKPVNEALGSRGVTCLMLRGNHDDPSCFDGKWLDMPSIKAVPDYTVADGRMLLVGGATSVDRCLRLPGRSYWSGEGCAFDEEAMDDIRDSGDRIECVLTHTCPAFCGITGNIGIAEFLARDKELAEDLRTERDVMTRLYDRLMADGHPLDKWAYGHFHLSKREVIEEGGRRILFAMLDMSGSWKKDAPDSIELFRDEEE